MLSTLKGLARWPAICVLAVLLAFLLPLIWIANALSGAGIAAAEPLKSKLNQLLHEAMQ